MTARWAVGTELAVTAPLAATRVVDATPIVATDVDVRTLKPGARPVFVLTAFETNVANTGGTWTVKESATNGGAYTDAKITPALVATPAVAGNNVQAVSVLPNSAKPFVRVVYTGVDANTEVDITVTLVSVPRNV